MKRYRAFLGLGSNLGERETFLKRALDAIKKVRETEVMWTSSVYETEPFGGQQQPTFLNAVLEIGTDLAPTELLNSIKSVESQLGRGSSEKWGPREIDIDILLYDGVVHQDASLSVPHPGLEDRKFALVPLAEIAPDVVHPINGMTVEEMARACRDTGRVVKTIHKLIM